ncbi:MAG: MarR family transcriptional regulator [Actinomycetota bacterium]|nr:MarR family transcriptional regulator [Actinomycetota bacterium]
MQRCDDARVLAWRALTRAHAILEAALDAALEEHSGVALLTYDVLSYLAEADGQRLRLQEIAERLPLTRSGLTRLIDRMEEADLVRRQVCSSDRRGTYAVLTPAGRRTLRRAGEVHVRILEERLVARLSPHELVCLRAACTKIASLVEDQPTND